VRLFTDQDFQAANLASHLQAHGLELHNLEPVAPTLEDIFLFLATGV
jgi:hypothetical protein